jgi:hypothetical protein
MLSREPQQEEDWTIAYTFTLLVFKAQGNSLMPRQVILCMCMYSMHADPRIRAGFSRRRCSKTSTNHLTTIGEHDELYIFLHWSLKQGSDHRRNVY